ncbi:glucan endo-1,3-beta-glucosidase 14-like [Impatiens glandulifera]|uniref:glucan endo-1,3-beta-glucosidase 14-like n=1 Tax=Impatiens glandulifera TaxID=253017 RepID=UPI001FB09418|nr:glucan endo-1,3-beta-glucosidase 14-like [Impatiens glandulifera]
MTSFNFSPLLFLLSLLGSSLLIPIRSIGVGINYGQIADNLPSHDRVAVLLKSLNITRVKLYDADPNVLRAFANSDVEFVLGLGGEQLQNMADLGKAQDWIQQNVVPFISQTKITSIIVGNEVLAGNDEQAITYLYPAMQTVYNALVNLGLSKQVYVTTAHSLAILANSFPPSSGSFKPDLAQYLQPILNFHAQVKSPFLINVYPYFAYKDSPSQIPLNYVLFEPNSGFVDPVTNLHYDNMLFAQIDAVYSAIRAMGHTDVQVKISETGWPSKGDQNEVGASVENAGIYNANLLKRIQENQATPANPSIPIDVYVFALFNENLKPGPTSERNYGLYYPDGRPVYDVGLQGILPPSISSSSGIYVSSIINFITLIFIAHNFTNSVYFYCLKLNLQALPILIVSMVQWIIMFA